MNRIAVLVDFTPVCTKAVEFGNEIAGRTGSELVLVHVAESFAEDRKAVQSKLDSLSLAVDDSVKVSSHIGEGSFFSVIPEVINELGADLVVVPTHGKVGIMQNLFGANILKLVKSLPVPSLVVQSSSQIDKPGFSKLLFPVGPHDDFNVKYEQTAAFAKVFKSTVQIYTVRNDIRGIPEKLRRNIAASKDHFSSQGVKFEEVTEEPTGFSVGYAKFILDYATKSGSNVICIMAKVSDDNGYIGNTDKENIILNPTGIPVFCANC